jgi:ParB family chromosome partitioning protein
VSIVDRKKSTRLNKTISNITVDRISAQGSSTVSHDLGELVELPLSKIIPDPNQPRKSLKNIDSLAKTIDENELIQPIIIREIDGGYMIIAGERRYTAFKHLGRETIPCIIREKSESTDILVLQLLENDQREKMHPLEVSDAINTLAQDDKLTVTQISKKLGVSKDWVSTRKQLKFINQKVKDLALSDKVLDVRTLVDLNRLNNVDSGATDKVIKKILANKISGSYRQYVQKEIERSGSRVTQVKEKKDDKVYQIEYLDEQNDRVIIKLSGSKKPMIMMKTESYQKL